MQVQWEYGLGETNIARGFCPIPSISGDVSRVCGSGRVCRYEVRCCFLAATTCKLRADSTKVVLDGQAAKFFNPNRRFCQPRMSEEPRRQRADARTPRAG